VVLLGHWDSVCAGPGNTEVEVDSLAQVEEALGVGVDAVLLNNMSLGDLKSKPSRWPPTS
jgi:nicotinate-nucleotide pyrophosphorylase